MRGLEYCHRNHHVERKTLMLKSKVAIRHIKCLNHHFLSDSDKHTYFESVYCNYLAWIFIFFINTLQSSIGEEYMQQILVYRVLHGQVRHLPKIFKVLQVLELGFDKVDYFGCVDVFDFCLAYERSNFTLSSSLRKLASKLVGVTG